MPTKQIKLSNRAQKRQQKQHALGNHSHKAVIGPAPFLHKERVVLTGIDTIAGGSNGGAYDTLVNGNGLTTSFAGQRVPQEALWNQYAAMYEYYQVKRIEFKYVPYRFQGHGSVNQVTVFNNYTIIQPDDTPALVNGSFNREGLFSFGNCNIHQGYQTIHRFIADYTNLCLAKQNEAILKTNGSAASRQLYIKPASIGFYGQANDFGTAVQGEVVFSIEYIFSGMKRPDVAMPQPCGQILWHDYAPQEEGDQGDKQPPPTNTKQASESQGMIGAQSRQEMRTRLLEQLALLPNRENDVSKC